MLFRMNFCVSSLILISISPSFIHAAVDSSDITSLIDWLNTDFADGFFLKDKLRVDPSGGVFATAPIARDELLLRVPEDATIIAPPPPDDEEDRPIMYCTLVAKMLEELDKGAGSRFAPYLNYLLKQDANPHPSTWSPQARKMLTNMLRQMDRVDDDDLRPEEPDNWLTKDWLVDCHGGTTVPELKFAMASVGRGWDDLMIPIYDLFQHRNGIENTQSNSMHDETFVLMAARDIEVGEELVRSYNLCGDCGRRDSGYGAPEILRDYGVIERPPQRWFMDIGREQLGYELSEPSEGMFRITWLGEEPDQNDMLFLESCYRHLTEFNKTLNAVTEEDGIAPHELGHLRDFHHNYVRSLSIAIQTYADTGCAEGDNVCGLSRRYDSLEEVPDETDYNIYTCDTDKSMSDAGYEYLERLQNMYHHLEFRRDPKDDNVCLDIENTVQMCGSYRPQYHELGVHFVGQFLPQVKRILFVGGGDSMLLHESLKYPSLEFVVGLELDQTVARYSFKHFGTSPHFHNPKVQWWFGDAAKSMLMLPKDYFGSFDMVLVDLSETVMSMTVTKKFDIMQALALLLKPDGIFIKNEHYLEALSNIFDYTIQGLWPDVAVTCSQTYAMGSNKLDFLYAGHFDHPMNEENLYMDKLGDRYEYFHDYRRNHASRPCKEDDTPDPVPAEQKASPGILMILEAENCTLDLADADAVKTKVTEVVEAEGLTVVANLDRGASMTFVLGEAYLVVRLYPENNYAAVDMHFWSSFDKQWSTRNGLVTMFGASDKSSSYRIVAGGIFGISTWKEDEMKRGPKVTEECKKDTHGPRITPVDENVAIAILEESLSLFTPESGAAVVLCGSKNKECKALDTARKHAGFSSVMPIYACDELEDLNEFSEGVVDIMKTCEASIHKDLWEQSSKVRAVIIDNNAPLLLGQVFYRIIATDRSNVMDDDVFVVATMLYDTDLWRGNLLERFRKDIVFYDPNFKARVLFNSTQSTFELGIMTAGDPEFVHRLKDAVARMEEKTGLVSDIRDITGGQVPYLDDYEPTYYFLPEDWDQSKPYEQYMSQQPVAYQVMFQTEVRSAEEGKLPVKPPTPLDFKTALQRALVSLNKDSVAMSEAEVSLSEMGDGCVVVAVWEGGNCVALWDGRNHVDLNYFSMTESKELADKIGMRFIANLKLKMILRDVQPRGYGRVVNFRNDLEPRTKPHWAKGINDGE